jgi:hypothetical protein
MAYSPTREMALGWFMKAGVLWHACAIYIGYKQIIKEFYVLVSSTSHKQDTNLLITICCGKGNDPDHCSSICPCNLHELCLAELNQFHCCEDTFFH